MSVAQQVFRFAPSPNGLMHLGHARSALMNFRAARATGGRFLLRIEDIDQARAREEHVAAILDDLRWLGLDWEQPVRRQSQHMAEYRAGLDGLRARGLVYPCFCSRGEIARAISATGAAVARDPDGSPHYPGTCRQLGARQVVARIAGGASPAWRLDMQSALGTLGARADALSWRELASPVSEAGRVEPARPEAWGDIVVARADVPTSYHLSVVLDDALQGVTRVVRGSDLFQATAVQRLLQELLVLAPPAYHHHALILDATGHKLSKSRASPSLAQMRADGASRDDIIRLVGLD
jgi:glutamyl-Q tRNA(Asp) synthetase